LTSRLITVVLLAVVILGMIIPGTALSADISLNFSLDREKVIITGEKPGKESVSVARYQSTAYLDYPSIPYRVISVLLPQGEAVSSVSLEDVKIFSSGEKYSLKPFEGTKLNDGTLLGLAADREEIVGPESVFPKWRVRHLGTNTYRGYILASIAVYPVRYSIDSNELEIIESARILVQTRADDSPGRSVRRIRHIEGFRDESRKFVEHITENPRMTSSYTFQDIQVDDTQRAFLPSYLPSMEGSEVRYLIVTNELMKQSFQALADHKTRKGVPAVVRTVEWIKQNARNGADLAETIRNFISDAYAKWGVEYVLLGGDTDVIPERLGYTTYYTGEFIPTDMYYSCLDGNWNADGDSLWGEAFHSTQDPGDQVDLYSEVYLGRMPASKVSEAEILIGKTLDYEAPADSVSKQKFLMLGEVIWPDPWNGTDPVSTDGGEILELIYQTYLSGHPEITTDRLFENYTAYPGSIVLTKANTMTYLEEGTNHVVHAGHGFSYNMSVGDANILTADAASLTNGDKLYSMYLMNCTNASFDTDCLAESFLLNDDGGAYAVTGSSRSAFPSTSRLYLDEYYYLLFDHNIQELGKLHVLSREPFTPSAAGESSDRWTHFIYNLLGDPESMMYRGAVRVFDVSVPASVNMGENDITVQVSSEGAPYDSARVCLYKSEDDYAYGRTGPSGDITFSDFLCRGPGWIYVTVTGLNHGVYLDSIQVLQESSAYLRVSDRMLTDSSGGNGDGILDSGETVDLSLELTNTGGTTAEDIYLIISTADTGVTILDSTSVYSNIPAGGEMYGSEGFSFSVSSGYSDEETIEFRADIHDSTGSLWSETFALVVHAPEIELYVNSKSDQAPYGDGDGIIEEGESFLLKVGIRNFGTGAAVSLDGKIISQDPDITVTDSLSAYGDVDCLTTEYGDGFVLSETNITQNNHFLLTLTDQYGREFSRQMELRSPPAPVALNLDATLGPTEMAANWHDGPSGDTLSKYLVYNSLTSGGPYEQSSTDLVHHTTFHDYDLLPSTLYYYVVSAVDSCGNVSYQSSEAFASTNAPQLEGWPNLVESSTSSSISIGDIDGDRYNELVIGAEYLYAWHADGIEVRDGDNKPVSWGIFSKKGKNYTATVALVELDEQPGAEIIGASWDTKEIYVLDHNGNDLPGWPKSTVDYCWASPIAGDLDGDGDLEIIAYDFDGTVYVWHHDGTELMDGDGNPSTDGIFFSAGEPSDGGHVSTPALGDMDSDGIAELIVCAPKDSIYCLNQDGTAVVGWPVSIGETTANMAASPAVGDIDGDGYLEVVVQNSAWRFMGLNHDGTYMYGWPKWLNTGGYFVGSPALGDLTGDGRLEVVIPGQDGNCYIYRYDGSLLPNWPQRFDNLGGQQESSPVIADLNGDGSLDIVLGGQEGLINAWDVSGNYIAGFPAKIKGFLRGTPAVKDLDKDGDVELAACGYDLNVNVWDLEGETYYNYDPWPSFHCNIHNNGWAEYVGVTSTCEIAYDYQIKSGLVKLDWLISSGSDYWSIYRKAAGEEYSLISKRIRPDQSGLIEYVDATAQEGLTYFYKIQSDEDDKLFVETEGVNIPVTRARLYQNYPNPFNPSTRIAFTVPGTDDSSSNTLLLVYDARGALVKTLVNRPMSGGRHVIEWRGDNDRGAGVSTGVYFARLRVGGVKDTKKMILLR